MVTPQQKAHFYDFGFVRLKQQFTAEEMGALSDEVNKLFEEGRGGGPPSGQNEGMVPAPVGAVRPQQSPRDLVTTLSPPSQHLSGR